MNIGIVEGKKDGSSLYDCGDGFHYHFNKGNNYNEGNSSVFYLRCRKYYKRGCCGTAKIESRPDGITWVNLQRHTCAPTPTHHQMLNLRREILNEAAQLDGPYETPAQVVRRVRQRYPDLVAAQVTGDRMRSAIRRKRMRHYPNVPRSLYDLGDLLQDENNRPLTTCKDGVDNIFGGRVLGPNGTCSIIFVSRRIRRYMRTCKTIFCDGTFGSRPNSPQSAQVLQIVGVKGNTVIPLVQILTSGKTYEEYVAVLNRLRQLVPQFRPNLVVTDYEINLQQAWRHVFNVTVTGCYWHYARAVSLKAKQLGLGPLMRDNRVLRSIVRSTLAIPLLRRDLMVRGLQGLIREAAAANLIPVLQPFFNYYINTWMSPAFFASLSVYGARHRTNNICESANKILRSMTGAHRPSLWHFLSALKRYEHDTRLTIMRSLLGMRLSRRRKVSAVNNDRRIRNYTLDLMTGEISINRFLHLASTRVVRVFDNFNGV